MKSVFICAPSIGNYAQNKAYAHGLHYLALKQGHFPITGSPQMPGNEAADELESIQLRQCDEVWLYYDGHKLRRDMLVDIQRAASADKPIRLVQHEPTLEEWPMTKKSWPFAADSYASAPDHDEEPSPDLTVNIPMQPLNIASLLLALKELEELLGGGIIPVGWWSDAMEGGEDYLLKFGIDSLLKTLNTLIRLELLPPWPENWPEGLAAQFSEAWDWSAELPDLDRKKLKLVDDNDWHKLGYLQMTRGEYWRAFLFLDKALTDNSHNYLAWSDVGECCLRLCDFGLALEAFEVTLMLAPEHFYAWLGKGRALMALAQYPEAIDAFDHALACKKSRVDPYVSDLRAKAVSAFKLISN